MSAVPHTRVEYDLEFTGGDYSDVGQFAYIPHRVIDEFGGGIQEAFKAHTGIDPVHIVNYNLDEAYDANGRFLEDWDSDVTEEPIAKAPGR